MGTMHTEKSKKIKSVQHFRTPAFLFFAAALALSGCINPQSRWSNGGLGIRLAQVEDGTVIKDIAPTFDNPDAALKKGDYIIKVDGQDVGNLPKEAILDIISGPVGGTVVVTVLRKKQLITLEIERILQNKAERRTLYSVIQNEAALTPAKPRAKAPAVSEETAETSPSDSTREANAESAADDTDADTANDAANDTVNDTVNDTKNDAVPEDADTEKSESDDIKADTDSSTTSNPDAAATPAED